MTGTWRDFSDGLTEKARRLFEIAERRGDDPAELRRYAEHMLDSESFQLACEAISVDPRLTTVSRTAWARPDDRHDETYCELVTAEAKVGKVEISTMADVSLDGSVLRPFIYLDADLATLSAEDARQVVGELLAAIERVDALGSE